LFKGDHLLTILFCTFNSFNIKHVLYVKYETLILFTLFWAKWLVMSTLWDSSYLKCLFIHP